MLRMKPALIVLVALIATIPAFGQDRGWIGISIAEQSERGVLVRSVEPNSPAEKAGFKANDIILQYGRQDVIGVLQLTRLVSETPVGRIIEVTIRRDNREQTLKVTTERAPLTIGGYRIQRPDLSAINDRVVRGIEDVYRSVSISQAGIRVESLTPQLREFFGVKAGEGVLVASVDADSSAGKAGLKAGDVITAIDGRSVSTPAEFGREVRSRTTSFSLKIVRDKQEREIRIERQTDSKANL